MYWPDNVLQKVSWKFHLTTSRVTNNVPKIIHLVEYLCVADSNHSETRLSLHTISNSNS